MMKNKLLISVIIVFILAGDCIALAAEFAILRPQPLLTYNETDSMSVLSAHMPGNSEMAISLPIPKLLFYAFYSGGVFNSVATFNLDYAIYAQPKGAKEGEPWVDLDYVKQCLPFGLGETYLRLDLEWHRLLGEKVYQDAIHALAAKIREKYNREHPNNQMQKVAIYMMWWPRSEKSYTEMRYPSTTHWLLLVSEK